MVMILPPRPCDGQIMVIQRFKWWKRASIEFLDMESNIFETTQVMPGDDSDSADFFGRLHLWAA